MSALKLTVDLVDNAKEYGITDADWKTKSPPGWLTSWYRYTWRKERRPQSGTVWAGNTEYTTPKAAAILRDYLQPPFKMSLKETKKAILTLLPDGANDSKELADFGDLCIELVVQIPYDHPSQLRLVRLLHAISRSTKISYHMPPTDNTGGCYYAYRMLWEAVADYISMPDKDYPDEWVNMNAFRARMCAVGVWPTITPIYLLREVFEDPRPDDAWEHDCNIMAATQWIIWSGQLVFQFLVYDMTIETDRTWILGSNLKGSSMQIRSIERWRFWKKGFDDVANGTEASDQCKSLSRRAAAMMAGIEEAMWFEEANCVGQEIVPW